MRFAASITVSTICALLLISPTVSAQDVTRELKVAPGAMLEIVNRFGRVAVRAEPAKGETPVTASLNAQSPAGVSEAEIKVNDSNGRTAVNITATDRKKRIDLIIVVPEDCKLKIETTEGAVELVGHFASVEARTETGTIVTDIPTDDLKYQFTWTESRPRYLADFDIADVREKSAGRFEIKGHYPANGETKSKKEKKNPDPAGDEQRTTNDEQPSKTEDQKPKTISLVFTTARGIILLNVPPNEVMSDLRERPLTNAAKAIIRSGDSLLTEAIRRASPKYFGDYARTLPPMRLEPKFATKGESLLVPAGAVKTALVRVTDLRNRSIDGLKASDFEVTESGTTREIVSVTRSTAPFNLVLLLDVSGSVENYVNFIRKAARSFVDTVHRDDRLSIVIFNDDVKMLSTFTTDKGKLSESLDTFDAGGGTAYYDALAYAVADTLRPLKGQRTAIVVLTDGDDNRSFLAFDSLQGSIQESGALVYPLYVPSGLIALAAQNPNADIDPMRKKYMSLTAKSEGEGEKLAQISGGVYYPITQLSQIQEAYEDIVRQMRVAYNVTYRSDGATTAAGASPRLKIRAKRDNVFTAITAVHVAQDN
jgi:VWFA-related protein